MKNILITGSSGCIGRNLVEQFNAKYNLYTPKHKDLDLLDEKATKKYFQIHKIDIVVHCAVIGGTRKSKQERDAFFNNTKMFFNIIWNKKYFKKMINLGSGAEYDKKFPIVKIKEDDFDKRIPTDEYGFYKYICSKYIETVENIINIRSFGIFGKYEDYKLRFISNAICKNIFSLPITIEQNIFFDYLFVNDLVKIIEYFINNKTRNKFYNVGRGEKIDLVAIANKINFISNTKSKIIVKKSGLNNEYTCNNSRLMREIEGFKFTDFDESLRQLYNWYKSRKYLLNKNDFLTDEE